MSQLVCHEEIITAASSDHHQAEQQQQQQQHLIVNNSKEQQQQNGDALAAFPPPSSPAKTDASPPELPAKRPSPWRKSPSSSSNVEPNKNNNKNKKKKSDNSHRPQAGAVHHHHHNNERERVYRDCISVQIPLNVTADLGVAMKHTRSKRVAALKRAFPSLTKNNNNNGSKDDDDKDDNDDNVGEVKDDDDDRNKGETTKDEVDERPKKKVKKLANVPQPGDFGNMIDYLEAKYVQGVMLENEDAVDDDDEGQGSVYSETSFLDDTDLQRTVAEQVLAHTTTTKLELLQDDDDDNAFFVNVGNLEVEETETTHDQYDPLQDTNDKKKSPKRKRKKSTSTTATTTSAASSSKDNTGKTNGKKNGETVTSASSSSKTNSASSSVPKKKKAKVAHDKDENEKPNKKSAPSSTTTATAVSADQVEGLQQISMDRKAASDELYQSLVSMIKAFTADELPRRKTKDRVALICPEDKKPGDSILFTNPHVPGQRCKVTIPKNTAPGSSFKATVPVPDTTDEDYDYNRLSRAFYDGLVDYTRAYDLWCDAEGDVRKARGDTDYTAHFEKRKKFDELIGQFPKDLKTPVDAPYIKKILRRARQNRSKREQNAQARRATTTTVKKEGGEGGGGGKGKTKGAAAKAASSSSSSAAAASKPKAVTKTILVPELSTEFATKPFDPEVF